VRDELNDYQRKLVFEAHKTHNTAAIPNAYSKASIYAYNTRASATIASYLSALDTFGIDVDDSIELEMLGLIGQLTGAHPSLSMPPGVKPPNLSAVRRSHAMELMRQGNSLQREASNRLREIKIKARRTRSTASSATTMTPTEPFTIASAAKALAELKKLPVSEQASLLLRMLVLIEPQVRGDGGLSKYNLSMPGDHLGLARGFPDSEKDAVRLHLLGAPWTRLVNDGFLVDPRGSGFYLISEEGHAADQTRLLPVAEQQMTAKIDGVPTVFISYSWDSDAHKQWAMRLATGLRSKGINVILDEWSWRIGGDKAHFMENNIRISDFVIIICTPEYAKKANGRTSGVGYEAMIITSQIAQDILQHKFIPVLRFGEWNDTAVPIWLQSKRGVDLRGDPYDPKQYAILLRALHKADAAAPPIGPKPDFMADDAGIVDNAVGPLLEQEGEPTTSSPAIKTKPSPAAPRRPPVAYAWYEKKGTSERIKVHVRPTDDGQFIFEPSPIGEVLEGPEDKIDMKYRTFDLELKQKGFTRTQTFNGTGGRSFNLP
jgi:hypothetical protein